MVRRLVLISTVSALLAAGCGADMGDDSATTTPAPTTTSSTTTTIPMPPDEPVDPGTAASQADGTPVVVTGVFFDEAGSVRLCSALAESFPPQCGGPSIDVTGLDRADVVGVSTPREPGLADVAWTDFLVTVEGVVRGGTLEAEQVQQTVFEAVDGDLRVRLAVEPAVLQTGRPVAFALDVTNLGSAPIDVLFSSGQDADVRFFDGDGNSVYTWSAAVSFIQMERTVTLEPGVPYGVVLTDQLTPQPGDYVVQAGFVARDLSTILVSADITIS